MPILSTCPSCNRQLRIPDELLNSQVKCPQCGTTFTATAGGEFVPSGFESQAGLGSRDEAAAKVKGPAIALLVMAILGALWALYNVGSGVILLAAGQDPGKQAGEQFRKDIEQKEKEGGEKIPEEAKKLVENLFGVAGPLGIGLGLLALVIAALIIVASIKMMNLKSRGLAMTASILAMTPCFFPCCVLGLPFGIWSLVVLSKPEVKSAFQ